MWQPLDLSRRQIKTADRVGSCEIILPWPEGLPLGPPLSEGEERDATRAEHAAAEQIVGNAARSAGLVPVRSVVARLRRPHGMPRAHAIEHHLVLLVIGQRWVHATGRPAPAQSWHAAERIRAL